MQFEKVVSRGFQLLPGGFFESSPILVHCLGLLPLRKGEVVHERLHSLPLLASLKNYSFPGAIEVLSNMKARGLAIPLMASLVVRNCGLHGDAPRLQFVS